MQSGGSGDVVPGGKSQPGRPFHAACALNRCSKSFCGHGKLLLLRAAICIRSSFSPPPFHIDFTSAVFEKQPQKGNDPGSVARGELASLSCAGGAASHPLSGFVQSRRLLQRWVVHGLRVEGQGSKQASSRGRHHLKQSVWDCTEICLPVYAARSLKTLVDLGKKKKINPVFCASHCIYIRTDELMPFGRWVLPWLLETEPCGAGVLLRAAEVPARRRLSPGVAFLSLSSCKAVPCPKLLAAGGSGRQSSVPWT